MRICCYFDGACGPKNPGGTIGYGAEVYADNKNGEKLVSHAGGIKASRLNSNNVAEYRALRWLLEWLLENNLNNEHITIYGDSQLVAKQMNKRWRIRDGRYMSEALLCEKFLESFTDCRIRWIPREKNTSADELSKEGMQLISIASS